MVPNQKSLNLSPYSAIYDVVVPKDNMLWKINPFREGCYTEGAKSKTYSVTIKSNEHQEQVRFQESDYFKEKAKERYKIEAKNRN